ncbi:MAG: c-type cytochrome [Candidatus Binatia bacterium]
MSGRRLLFGLALVAVLAGCRQDMHDQPKVRPYRESEFFPDGLSARPVVPGTVARGQLRDDDALYLGKVDGKPVEVFPFAIERATIERGRERYDIYCAPCHDRLGNGQGVVVRRGYRRPPSFHADRLRLAPVGYFYDVITSGFGVMPGYAAQIPVHDRWAIISYLRALQLSQHLPVAMLPKEDAARLGEVP